MKLFSKLGFEPTFFPKLNLPAYIGEGSRIYGDEYWIMAYGMYYSSINGKIVKLISNLGFSKYVDSGSMELPTTKEYTDYALLKKQYRKLVRGLFKLKLHPSSKLCLMSEGGCHLNFSLSEVRDKGTSYTHLFLSNYRNYVLSHPSIVWMFLSPYDNVSSMLIFRGNVLKYDKGDFFTVRRCEDEVCTEQLNDSKTIEMLITNEVVIQSSYIQHSWDTIEYNWGVCFKEVGYIELRHFMMPRNDKEFDVHVEFANQLLGYIKHLTDEGECLRFRDKDIKRYTYLQTKREFVEVCQTVEFDFNKVKGVGKLQLLQKRFKLGKNYLV